MNATSENDWVDANQRLLVAEFARLKARLAGEDEAPAQAEIEAARAGLAAPAALDHLVRSFDLSDFERDLLLLAAGVEMNSELAALCASAAGAPNRAYATFGLALAALEDPHWSALAPIRPLRRWRLMDVDESVGLVSGRLRVDERVLHYLAGVNYLDQRLQPLLRPVSADRLMAEAHGRLCTQIANALDRAMAPMPLVQLAGDDPDGKEEAAARVAASFGLRLWVLNAEDIPAGVHEAEALAVLWGRESLLLNGALLIDCADGAHSPATARLSERMAGLLFIATREPIPLRRASHRYTVHKPDRLDQKRLWEQALGPQAARFNGALDGVAAQFRLSARSIGETARAVAEGLAGSVEPDALLWHACRKLDNKRLDELAQRIAPAAGWDDLILPEPQKSTLRQIAVHVRHRLKVYEEWGFAGKGPRGLGISALFAGESGTGKTMAAEVLANALHLDLYRIDLSAVVSKYIGETEKNLRRVFDAAEDSGAILLFDEADALFGKRSEVKDSHDRYANIEVSYLLQRMEAYRGLAILTTNIKTALDTAFQRRLRFVVQFPFPDQKQRESIWHGAFPGLTPTQALDYRKLAQLHVTGGHIRNIALNAAFLAADAAEPVAMAHLLHAAHREASKRDRSLSDAETRGWV